MSTEMQSMLDLAKGLQQSAQQAAEDTAGYLKFTKFGSWVHGTEANEVGEEELWVIHPQGFHHGWICWGDEAHGNECEKLGEVMVSATSPLPLADTLDEVKGSWSTQVSMQLLCLSGFDKGTKVVYNTNSVGGRKVYKAILNAVVAKIGEGSPQVAPVVKLEKDSYKHKKYGLIFNPIMEIQEYKSLGELEALMTNVGIEDQSESKESLPEKETMAETKEEPKRERKTRARRTTK